MAGRSPRWLTVGGRTAAIGQRPHHGDVTGVEAATDLGAEAVQRPDHLRPQPQWEDVGEGPRIDVVITGMPVTAADLSHAQAHTKWPRFAAQAPASGIRAVFAFHVQLDAQPVGVLSVYRAAAGPLGAADHRRVSRYARTATVLLHATAHVNGTGAASMPLPTDAGEVQQAVVGVVMQHATVDAVTALHHLRACAHHSLQPMRDVVAEARTGQLPFNPTTPA